MTPKRDFENIDRNNRNRGVFNRCTARKSKATAGSSYMAEAMKNKNQKDAMGIGTQPANSPLDVAPVRRLRAETPTFKALVLIKREAPNLTKDAKDLARSPAPNVPEHPFDKAEGAPQTYSVHIVNRSNWTIIGVQMGPDAQPLQVDPPIGRTCHASSSCDECKFAGRHSLLYTVPLPAQPFGLYVLFKIEVASQTFYARLDPPLPVSPTPAESGAVYCVEPADPMLGRGDFGEATTLAM